MTSDRHINDDSVLHEYDYEQDSDLDDDENDSDDIGWSVGPPRPSKFRLPPDVPGLFNGWYYQRARHKEASMAVWRTHLRQNHLPTPPVLVA